MDLPTDRYRTSLDCHASVPIDIRTFMSDSPASHLPQGLNLADARLGASVLSASDDFFAPRERLLNPAEPEWRAGVYDDHGKWMDGWESRRRRDQGHDHCIVQLGAAGTLTALDIDTRFFTGNYPPHASVEACFVRGKPDAATRWSELLPRVSLRGNSRNLFAVSSAMQITHLRLNIFPDGGVARLRAYGVVTPAFVPDTTGMVDLAAALNGGRALICSDEHYGAMSNLLLPGRATSMADGWETRRRREPGFDWVILQLGQPARIERVELDTACFKGNFPHQVSMHAALLPPSAPTDLASECLYWPVMLEPQLMKADAVQSFSTQVRDAGVVSHVRVDMHPDGGMSRVRLFGRVST
jgi:allantoicase